MKFATILLAALTSSQAFAATKFNYKSAHSIYIGGVAYQLEHELEIPQTEFFFNPIEKIRNEQTCASGLQGDRCYPNGFLEVTFRHNARFGSANVLLRDLSSGKVVAHTRFALPEFEFFAKTRFTDERSAELTQPSLASQVNDEILLIDSPVTSAGVRLRANIGPGGSERVVFVMAGTLAPTVQHRAVGPKTMQALLDLKSTNQRDLPGFKEIPDIDGLEAAVVVYEVEREIIHGREKEFLKTESSAVIPLTYLGSSQ
jgi:hypothetical protein